MLYIFQLFSFIFILMFFIPIQPLTRSMNKTREKKVQDLKT